MGILTPVIISISGLLFSKLTSVLKGVPPFRSVKQKTVPFSWLIFSLISDFNCSKDSPSLKLTVWQFSCLPQIISADFNNSGAELPCVQIITPTI